ncbi:MAG: hypothetical protein GY950_22015, partial [bacterium]|nr:hypothetical protein [bacterium]
VTYGDRAVAHADKNGDWQLESIQRSIHADALHQAGQWNEAEKLFRESEGMQKERHSKYNYLISLWGYRFCDLLLGQGKVDEVMERAQQTLEWIKKENWPFEVALDHLTLGRAWMMAAQQKQDKTKTEKAWAHAFQFLHQAVEGLRKGQRQDYLPLGLLARATAFRLKREFDNAWIDLNETLEIAEIGGMKLHITDYHLEAAWLCRDEGKGMESEKHVKIAEEMIEETGYLRRGKEVKEIIN